MYDFINASLLEGPPLKTGIAWTILDWILDWIHSLPDILLTCFSYIYEPISCIRTWPVLIAWLTTFSLVTYRVSLRLFPGIDRRIILLALLILLTIIVSCFASGSEWCSPEPYPGWANWERRKWAEEYLLRQEEYVGCGAGDDSWKDGSLFWEPDNLDEQDWDWDYLS